MRLLQARDGDRRIEAEQTSRRGIKRQCGSRSRSRKQLRNRYGATERPVRSIERRVCATERGSPSRSDERRRVDVSERSSRLRISGLDWSVPVTSKGEEEQVSFTFSSSLAKTRRCESSEASALLPSHRRSSTPLVQRGVANSPSPTNCPRSTTGLRLSYRFAVLGGDCGLVGTELAVTDRAVYLLKIRGDVVTAKEDKLAAAEAEYVSPAGPPAAASLLGHLARVKVVSCEGIRMRLDEYPSADELEAEVEVLDERNDWAENVVSSSLSSTSASLKLSRDDGMVVLMTGEPEESNSTVPSHELSFCRLFAGAEVWLGEPEPSASVANFPARSVGLS